MKVQEEKIRRKCLSRSFNCNIPKTDANSGGKCKANTVKYEREDLINIT